MTARFAVNGLFAAVLGEACRMIFNNPAAGIISNQFIADREQQGFRITFDPIIR